MVVLSKPEWNLQSPSFSYMRSHRWRKQINEFSTTPSKTLSQFNSLNSLLLFISRVNSLLCVIVYWLCVTCTDVRTHVQTCSYQRDVYMHANENSINLHTARTKLSYRRSSMLVQKDCICIIDKPAVTLRRALKKYCDKKTISTI